MTESIFDPTGDQTEKDGARYTGPEADNDSRMPPEAVDGEIDETEKSTDDDAGDADGEQAEVDDLDSEENLRPVAMNEEDAAEQLRNMFDQSEEEPEGEAEAADEDRV